VTLALVRHAKAGDRAAWLGAAPDRPLTKAGRRQADALVARLGDLAPTRVESSPYARCVATVAPLADHLGLAVELDDAWAEGATFERAWERVLELGRGDAVVCSHGDVIGAVLVHASDRGCELPGNRIEKASAWLLDIVDDEVIAARYLSPPPVA
jgi:broad specificity phosphatase PhoE